MAALDVAASQSSEQLRGDEAEGEQQECGAPASLLSLPAALLHSVVAALTLAADLAAAAASCSALRDVVMSASWDQVCQYEAHR